MTSAQLTAFAAALLAVLNPIGTAPIFIAMTEGHDPRERAGIARSAALTVTITLLGAALAGKALLHFFGVSVDSFRVAGGLIVLLMALGMLRAEPTRLRATIEERAEGAAKSNPGVFPIAIPLLAGPGAISTMLLWSGAVNDWPARAAMGAVTIGAGAVVYLVLLAATPLSRAFGVTGMNVLTRIMGLVLAAIAVEMMATGLRALLPALATSSPFPA